LAISGEPGTAKWVFNTYDHNHDGPSYIVSSPAISSDGTIYVGSRDNKLYAINPDGTKKWEFTSEGWVDSSPAIGPDGTIYVGSRDHYLYAINPNGTLKWKFKTGGYVYSSPAIGTDGVIYVGSNDGKVYAVNPDGTKQWEFTTGARVVSSPSIGPDGIVYVGSHDGKLYAIYSSSLGLANSPWPMFGHDLRHTSRAAREASAGSLTVTIEPPDAVTAGAQWRVDGGPWHDSGETQYGVSVGSHILSFSTVMGWSKPGNRAVTILENQQTQITGTYIATNIENCTFQGIVTATDASGNHLGPLPGALVNLSGYGATNTGDDGTYQFSSVPPGSYTVTVSKTGYYSSQKDISLEAGTTKTNNFTLTQVASSSSPVIFDFSSPDGKYFIEGITSPIHFKAKIAWNGPEGTVNFIVNGESYPGTVTDLGDGTALVEVTLPSLTTIATAHELAVEVTNGNGLTIVYEPGVHFSPILEHLPWADGPLTWTPSGPKLEFSKSGGFDFEVPTASDHIQMGLSLGYDIELSYDLLAGSLEGLLEGNGECSFKLPTSNPKIKILGEGKLSIGGELTLSVAELPRVIGDASWSFSDEGTTGIEAPVVIALDAVAPGVGSTLSSIPVINDATVGVYLTFGGELNGIYDDLEGGNCWFRADSNTGQITGRIKARLSAKIKKTEVGVYAGGNGTLNIDLCPDFSLRNFEGELFAAAYGKAFGFEIEKKVSSEFEWDFSESGAQVVKATAIAPISSTGVKATWTPIGKCPLEWGPTNRLARRMVATGTGSGIGAAEEERVVENVTWLAHPSVFADTTDTRVLYSLHDTEKPWYGATDIGQVLRHDNEEWVLSRITDDNAAEFNPEVAPVGSGNLLASWVRVSGDISGAQGPEDVIPHLEVVTSFYDAGTDSWSDPEQLTNNNVVDRDPKPVVFGEHTGIIWIENQGGVAPGTGSSGDALLYASWNGFSWDEPVTLWSGDRGILTFTFVSDGQGEAHVVMAVDNDGDLETRDDIELYHVYTEGGSWQEPVRLTEDSAADTLPVLVAPNGKPMVVWSCDGKLEYSLLESWDPREVYAQESLVGRAPTLAGVTMPAGAAIAYAAQSPDVVDIVASFYDADLDQWSMPRKLTHDNSVERAISMAYNGSKLVMAYLKTETVTQDIEVDMDGDGTNDTTIEGVPTPGKTDLYILTYCLGQDLAVDPGSVSTEPANPCPGTSALIHATVKNLGDLPVQNILVSAYDGDPYAGGTEIGQANIDSLAAGGSQDVSISWDVPEDPDSHRIFVVVDPDLNLDDRDRSNNKDSIWCVLPDMVVETSSGEMVGEGRFSITTKISNIGVIPTGLFTVSWRLGSTDGPEIESRQVETIPSGAFRELNILWDMNEYDVHTGTASICIIIDPLNEVTEANEANNTHFQAVAHPDALIDSDADGLSNYVEDRGCTLTDDADTDDDGIMDGDEDANHNGVVDPGETDPCNIDTDGDGFTDGQEDRNANGRRDPGERDPAVWNSRAMPWIPLLLGN